jgi:hypothetical protein
MLIFVSLLTEDPGAMFGGTNWSYKKKLNGVAGGPSVIGQEKVGKSTGIARRAQPKSEVRSLTINNCSTLNRFFHSSCQI